MRIDPHSPVAPESESSSVGAVLSALFLVVFLLLSAAVVIAVWPNTGIGRAQKLPLELRFLLLVASGGALGSSLQALYRLTEMIGTRRLIKGWRLWFVLRVVMGIPLSMIIYMGVRGGILSTTADATALNPYGTLAISILVGLFAAQALEKLNAVAATLFRDNSSLERQIDQIGSALAVATLDNYNGWVCLSIQDQSGGTIPFRDDEMPIFIAGRSYDLFVWFERSQPTGFPSEQIKITGGTDTSETEFSIISDSDGATLRPRQESIRFEVGGASIRVRFQITPSDTVGKHQLWIEISQKNRLVHVVSLDFNVQKGEKQDGSVRA